MMNGRAYRTLRLTAAVITAGAVMPSTIAHAQRLGMSSEQSQQASRDFVKCMVVKRKQLSEQYLSATDPTEFAKWRNRLWDNMRCNLKGFPAEYSGFRRLEMAIDVERGLIAEQLIAVGRVMPRTKAMKPSPYHGRWAAVTGRDPAVDEMADCVATSQPTGVISLLGSEAGSDAEKAAFEALGDVFGQCLVRGATLKANRLSMRGALAEALYQRAAAPASNSTAGIQ